MTYKADCTLSDLRGNHWKKNNSIIEEWYAIPLQPGQWISPLGKTATVNHTSNLLESNSMQFRYNQDNKLHVSD